MTSAYTKTHLIVFEENLAIMEATIVVLPRFSSWIRHGITNVARIDGLLSVMHSNASLGFPCGVVVVDLIPSGENDKVGHDGTTNNLTSNDSRRARLKK